MAAPAGRQNRTGAGTRLSVPARKQAQNAVSPVQPRGERLSPHSSHRRTFLLCYDISPNLTQEEVALPLKLPYAWRTRSRFLPPSAQSPVCLLSAFGEHGSYHRQAVARRLARGDLQSLRGGAVDRDSQAALQPQSGSGCAGRRHAGLSSPCGPRGPSP